MLTYIQIFLLPNFFASLATQLIDVLILNVVFLLETSCFTSVQGTQCCINRGGTAEVSTQCILFLLKSDQSRNICAFTYLI
jgi:hypothetical protein